MADTAVRPAVEQPPPGAEEPGTEARRNPLRRAARAVWRYVSRDLLPSEYLAPVVVTGSTSLLLGLGFLLLPLAGTDLAAQVARGHFFREYGFSAVDFRWYGGVFPFGYSGLTGPLNAVLGSRGVGAASCVVSAVAFAWLLCRTGVRRPLVGGLLAGVVGVCNLVSGRTTFALGVALGMCALCALVLPRVPERVRLLLAGLLAAVTSAGSPVAGVYVGLVGAALLVGGLTKVPIAGVFTADGMPALRERVIAWRAGFRVWLREWLRVQRREVLWRRGLALGIGSGVALIPPAFLFRDGGVQPFPEEPMKIAVATSVAVFFLTPRSARLVRVGAVLCAIGLLTIWSFDSPMGSNATRLTMMYAAPVVAAVATIDRRLLVLVLVAITWWQPPLVVDDMNSAGDRASRGLYYRPLVRELERRGPVGRIEVVPLRNHWESVYVAEAVPIARGWLRQVDWDRNKVFYDGSLDPASYLSWLYGNAVEYVAVAKTTALDFAGAPESALIEAELPYLQKVWETGDWVLYQVIGAPKLVSQPGVLVDSGPTGVAVDVPEPADVTVRVRWSRWLTLSGPDGCLEPDGKWVKLRATRTGRYEIRSGLHMTQSARC
jgi:hypothetical protein